MDLNKLREPFPADDIEWRVSRAGMGRNGIFCLVIAYITARAVQSRLDDVCGPQNWRLEEPRILTVDGKSAFACGLSLWLCDEREWITKWDVSEPTNIEAAKGGWSGALKRAAAQWGVGRYLYHLSETFADVTDAPVEGSRSWHYAKLPEKHGGAAYYWKAPNLPGWALPKEPEHEITKQELGEAMRRCGDAFADSKAGPKVLREGWDAFARSVVGEFPVSDYTCWTRDALDKCLARIAEGPQVADGPDTDVPFSE